MNELQNDLSEYTNYPDFKNKLIRFIWGIIWCLLARPFPRRIFNSWKIILLRLFGAKIHKSAVVYSTARIYLPYNLEIGQYSCIGPEVDCYNVTKVKIGDHVTISQKSYLCTASHDISKKGSPLIVAPIVIKDHAWIFADSYIGMGVTVGEGAVVGARSSVYKDVEPWTIAGGNPAKFIKKRIIQD